MRLIFLSPSLIGSIYGGVYHLNNRQVVLMGLNFCSLFPCLFIKVSFALIHLTIPLRLSMVLLKLMSRRILIPIPIRIPMLPLLLLHIHYCQHQILIRNLLLRWRFMTMIAKLLMSSLVFRSLQMTFGLFLTTLVTHLQRQRLLF